MSNSTLIKYAQTMTQTILASGDTSNYHYKEIAEVIHELQSQLSKNQEQYQKMLDAYLNE